MTKQEIHQAVVETLEKTLGELDEWDGVKLQDARFGTDVFYITGSNEEKMTEALFEKRGDKVIKRDIDVMVHMGGTVYELGVKPAGGAADKVAKTSKPATGRDPQQGTTALLTAVKSELAEMDRKRQRETDQLQLEMQQMSGNVADIGRRVGENKNIMQQVQAVSTNTRRELGEGFTMVNNQFAVAETRASQRAQTLQVAAQSMSELSRLIKDQEKAMAQDAQQQTPMRGVTAPGALTAETPPTPQDLQRVRAILDMMQGGAPTSPGYKVQKAHCFSMFDTICQHTHTEHDMCVTTQADRQKLPTYLHI